MNNQTVTRDSYNAINMSSLDETTRTAISCLVDRIAAADKVDEHGAWDFRAEFDKKGRGQAINWDLYGVGNDVHTGDLLAVIQVRQYTKQHKNWYPQVRKNYFLIGENEDGTVFAHSVSANVIHAAIRAERDVILAVQNWIFGGDYESLVRHGDLALIPMKSRPAGTKGQMRKVAVLEGSHRLEATQIADVDGRIYAKNPTLIHLPGTHPTAESTGWNRVVIGRRADFWKFAAPTID